MSQQRDAHLHEEDLHLQLRDPAPQALPGAETKAQPLEVLGVSPQPALRDELLRLREHLGIPAHGVETDLHQRLQGGRISPVGLGSLWGFTGAWGAGIQPQWMSPIHAPGPSSTHPEPHAERVGMRRDPVLTLGGMR